MENKTDERPGHLTMARAGGPSLFAINGNNVITVTMQTLKLPGPVESEMQKIQKKTRRCPAKDDQG